MADSVYSGMEVRISGLDKIEQKLKTLEEKVRRKHIKKAMQKGVELVETEARIRTPKSMRQRHPKAPHLRDAIASKVTVGAYSAQGRVGVDYTKVHTGHLVEFGTKAHKAGLVVKFGKRKGKQVVFYTPEQGFRRLVNPQHPGARAKPFLGPAFDSKGNDAVNEMITRLAKAVETEASLGS